MSVTRWQPPVTRPPCKYCGYPADPGERLCERCLPACDVRAAEARMLAKHTESASRRAGTDRREQR